MAKNKKVVNFFMWLVGIIVALAIGFALTARTLTVPFLPSIITVIAGWIVIASVAISFLMWLVKAMS